MRNILSILTILLLGFGAFGQSSDEGTVSGGIQLQVYPTGFIPGLSAEIILSDHFSIDFRAGVNIVRHGDKGKNDDERGYGLGLSHGVKYALSNSREKWYIGARMDIWFNNVDWMDDIGGPEIASGTTEVTVLQPTALLGYKWRSSERITIVPEVAFGAEINANTEGREVGEGAILLLGVTGYYYL